MQKNKKRNLRRIGLTTATLAVAAAPIATVVSCSPWGDHELNFGWFDKLVYYYNDAKYDAGWGDTILPAVKKYYNLAVKEAVKKGHMSKPIELEMKKGSNENFAVKKMTDLWGYRDSKSPDVWESGPDTSVLVTKSGTPIFHQFKGEGGKKSTDGKFAFDDNSANAWYQYLFKSTSQFPGSKIFESPKGTIEGPGNNAYPSKGEFKVPTLSSMPWYGTAFVNYHWNDDSVNLENQLDYQKKYRTKVDNIFNGKVWLSNKAFAGVDAAGNAKDNSLIGNAANGILDQNQMQILDKDGNFENRTKLYEAGKDMDMASTLWATNNAWNRIGLTDTYLTYMRGDKGIYNDAKSYMKYGTSGYSNSTKDFAYIAQVPDGASADDIKKAGLHSLVYAPNGDQTGRTANVGVAGAKPIGPTFNAHTSTIIRPNEPGKYIAKKDGTPLTKMSDIILALNEMMMYPTKADEYSSWDKTDHAVLSADGHINGGGGMAWPRKFTLPQVNTGDMPTLARTNIAGLVGASLDAKTEDQMNDISNTPDDRHKYKDIIMAQADWLGGFTDIAKETKFASDPDKLFGHLSVYPTPSRFVMDDGQEKDMNLAVPNRDKSGKRVPGFTYKKVTSLDGNPIAGLQDHKATIVHPYAVNKDQVDGRNLFFNKRNWEITDKTKRADKTYALKILGAILEGNLDPEGIADDQGTSQAFKDLVIKDGSAVARAFVVDSGYLPYSNFMTKNAQDGFKDAKGNYKTQKDRVTAELLNSVKNTYMPDDDKDAAAIDNNNFDQREADDWNGKQPINPGIKAKHKANPFGVNLFKKQLWNIASDYRDYSTYYWWGAWAQLQNGDKFKSMYTPYDVADDMFQYTNGHFKAFNFDDISLYGTPNNAAVSKVDSAPMKTADRSAWDIYNAPNA